MGCSARIDYKLFLRLCDGAVPLGEMLEAIEYCEKLEAEERGTDFACDLYDTIRTNF